MTEQTIASTTFTERTVEDHRISNTTFTEVNHP